MQSDIELCENMDFVERYGDPTLNDRQRLAIGKAMTYSFTMIQGPPGTGKTTVASNITNV